MANKPIFGQDAINSMNSDVYMRITDGTFLTQGATAVLTKGMLNGTVGVYTATFPDSDDAGTAAYDGNYFLISSVANTFCVWFKESISSVTKPIVSGSTAYVQITYTADATGAQMATLIYNAMSRLADFAIIKDSDELEFTCTQGGLCDIPDVAGMSTVDTVALTFTSTAGIGDWAKIGWVAEGIELKPEPVKVTNSAKEEGTISYDVPMSFNLMNVTKRTWQIIRDEYNNRNCDFAFMSPKSAKCPVVLVYDMPLDAVLSPFDGEYLQIMCSGKQNYDDLDTYIDLWTHEQVYA